VLLVELLDRQDRRDLLAFLEREEIDDRPAARGPLPFRRFVDLEPINPAATGKT
jgi:hypothetical protein